MERFAPPRKRSGCADWLAVRPALVQSRDMRGRTKLQSICTWPSDGAECWWGSASFHLISPAQGVYPLWNQTRWRSGSEGREEVAVPHSSSGLLARIYSGIGASSRSILQPALTASVGAPVQTAEVEQARGVAGEWVSMVLA
ncbi:hypothetical protein O3P69_001453 [Scylla paramamosain]|uniref:Uncharacterized protein n=1 Tax=Scylla paramamosain TaxID=85552 RepID=A0AAW0UYT0_SCYPA